MAGPTIWASPSRSSTTTIPCSSARRGWAFVHRYDSSGNFDPETKSWTSPEIFNTAGAYAVARDDDNGRHDFEVRGIDKFTFGTAVIIGTSIHEDGTSMILQGLHQEGVVAEEALVAAAAGPGRATDGGGDQGEEVARRTPLGVFARGGEVEYPPSAMCGSVRVDSTPRGRVICFAMAPCLALALALAGCSREATPPTSTGEVLPSMSTSGGTSMSTSSTAGASSGTSSGASTASTSTSSPSTSEASTASSSVTENATTFDVGWDKDFDDPTPAGCQGKIDFLFVLSEHGTLKEENAGLAAAFPKWIETIESKFESFDFQIMVVGSDDLWGQSGCNSWCEEGCVVGDGCCPWFDPDNDGQMCCGEEQYPCELMDLLTTCDWTMGAGTVFPAGNDASNEPCKFAGGHRYMTSEEPELAEAFTCAAGVGWGGYNRGGDALMQAISPSLNGPGGCNEGFLRDDALLMITWLAPGSDDSKGIVYPWEWYDAVVEAKHGDPNSVIALSLSNIECPQFFDTPCEFTKLFPHHVISDNDGPYAPAFDEATDLVEAACEAFIPQ